MTDEVWKRDEIASPCVKICVMHPEEGLCLGCWRTLDEIARWGMMPGAERAALIDALPARAERVKARRRGGRAARVPRP
ncbi:DUF1289 domain-containing protein [Frigidibacter sp. MR17.14]|uniref:DUF1289 domain-containing protein n=1 Tax=Frigidibacter sp. MR17.14 TaxID=3126509 RepID=UPI003012E14D